jgi:hypothetical protein
MSADAASDLHTLQERSQGAVLCRTVFGLQKIADGSTGERLVHHPTRSCRQDAGCSKPMSESDTRSALHKMGNSDAAIASMFERAPFLSFAKTL